jgi:hypothetical protein
VQPRDLKRSIERWLLPRPGVFTLQPVQDSLLLTELATGKSLRLEAEEVQRVESHRNWNTGAEYLRLLSEARPPLALADVGFVFALDTRNTGPLPQAPPTLSFGDFQRLLRHVQHLLDELDVSERRREALDITMVLIASLDGAHAVGLPTQAEEAQLEKVIRRLEA